MKDGIYINLIGAKYPLKNFPEDRIIFDCNQVKAIIIESVKNIKWYWIFIAPFLYKDRQNILDSFNRISWKIMSPHILKYQYMPPFCKTLHYVILRFLMGIGFTEESADTFALIFSSVVDYDGAYRYRVLDLMSETSKEKLSNSPRSEINRLIKLETERDDKFVGSKLNKVAMLVNVVLLIPKIRKAFIMAISTSNFEDLQADESDRYWFCIRTDYKFMGMSLEERKEYAKNKGWTYPLQINKKKL